MNINSTLLTVPPVQSSPVVKGNSSLSSDGSANAWQGLGNLFTGNLDWQRQQLLNQFNSAEAEKSRNWQEYMSNTSYQRMVKDMSLAGLNPYLAYNQGGASTPSGSTARSAGAPSSAGKGWSSLIGLASMVANTALGLEKLATDKAVRTADMALRREYYNSALRSKNYSRYFFGNDGEITHGYSHIYS